MIVVKIDNLKEDYEFGCVFISGFYFWVCHCPKTKELVADGCKCFLAHCLFQFYLCHYLCRSSRVDSCECGSDNIFFSLAKPI